MSYPESTPFLFRNNEIELSKMYGLAPVLALSPPSTLYTVLETKSKEVRVFDFTPLIFETTGATGDIRATISAYLSSSDRNGFDIATLGTPQLTGNLDGRKINTTPEFTLYQGSSVNSVTGDPDYLLAEIATEKDTGFFSTTSTSGSGGILDEAGYSIIVPPNETVLIQTVVTGTGLTQDGRVRVFISE